MTILQLLKEMIINSENTAYWALIRQLSDMDIHSFFIHIGIPDPYVITEKNLVSPRNYIRIFKSLYYSTYLSRDLSELALDLTTDTQEEDLISGGIPPEIQVAHKFGIFEETGALNRHDCGIVYLPKNNYFLCIMTKNLETTKSRELIQKLSQDIYEFIDKKSSIED